MCNKNRIPETEEKCRETKCNSIDDDLEDTQRYNDNIDHTSNEDSKEKVGCTMEK